MRDGDIGIKEIKYTEEEIRARFINEAYSLIADYEEENPGESASLEDLTFNVKVFKNDKDEFIFILNAWYENWGYGLRIYHQTEDMIRRAEELF